MIKAAVTMLPGGQWVLRVVRAGDPPEEPRAKTVRSVARTVARPRTLTRRMHPGQLHAQLNIRDSKKP